MNTDKQAAIAAALAKGVAAKIPEIEDQVPSFLRGMIPDITPQEETEVGTYLGAIAAKASDDWDAAHPVDTLRA